MRCIDTHIMLPGRFTFYQRQNVSYYLCLGHLRLKSDETSPGMTKVRFKQRYEKSNEMLSKITHSKRVASRMNFLTNFKLK